MSTGVHSIVYDAPSFAFIANLQYSVKCNGIVETGEREYRRERERRRGSIVESFMFNFNLHFEFLDRGYYFFEIIFISLYISFSFFFKLLPPLIFSTHRNIFMFIIMFVVVITVVSIILSLALFSFDSFFMSLKADYISSLYLHH